MKLWHLLVYMSLFIISSTIALLTMEVEQDIEIMYISLLMNTSHVHENIYIKTWVKPGYQNQLSMLTFISLLVQMKAPMI